MHDYYEILEVSCQADGNEIKRAYRRLALTCHPDRNPGDPEAEDRFKLVSEAYAVLMDDTKRRQYDFARAAGRTTGNGAGFGYSQEEIFRDLFSNPHVSRVFTDLFSEFEKAGFRTDPQYFENLFFRGRGGLVLGGMLLFGALGATFRELNRAQVPQPVKKPGLLARLGKKALYWLLDVPAEPPEKKETPFETPRKKEEPSEPLDLTYHLAISREQASAGGEVEVSVDRNGRKEKLRVMIPAGVSPQTRLRLRGKGLMRQGAVGDLFLVVNVNTG